jgi:hypothetical protein
LCVPPDEPAGDQRRSEPTGRHRDRQSGGDIRAQGVTVTASEDATFECRVTPLVQTGDPQFVPCKSPFAHDTPQEGQHLFDVSATDTAAPSVTTRPRGSSSTAIAPAPVAASQVDATTLAFSPKEPDAAFECRLEGPSGDSGSCRASRRRAIPTSRPATTASCSGRSTPPATTPTRTPARSPWPSHGRWRRHHADSGCDGFVQLKLTEETSSAPAASTARRRLRGTTWLVQDSCDGRLTRVADGVVSVRDFSAKDRPRSRRKEMPGQVEAVIVPLMT